MASTRCTTAYQTVSAVLWVALISTSSLFAASRKTDGPMPALRGQPAIDYLKSHGLYDSLENAVEASRYAMKPDTAPMEAGREVHAENPAQGMTASFGSGGFSARSSSKAADPWTFSMRPVGIGYGETLPVAEGAGITTMGERVEIQRRELTEWYVNRPSGIEQGFTLASRPPGATDAAPLRFVMEWNGNLEPRVSGNAIALSRKSGSRVLLYDGLSVKDASGRALAARFEATDCTVSILVDDSEASYPVAIDPILTQVAELTASDGSAGDVFGISVAVSGDTAVVGALGKDSGTGAAYLFERNAGGADGWGQVKELTASDGAPSDVFGNSVAISGDTAVVGAAQQSSSTGAAYVFARNNGGSDNWGQVKKLTASDGSAGDFFGVSVAISGDTAIVGASLRSSFTGGAYVFERNSGGADNWGQVKELTASDGASNDVFGDSVAISGDTAVVGAAQQSSSTGAAYVFARNNGGSDNWGQVKKLTASDGSSGDQFGLSVALSGDTAVVGAFGKSSFQGGAYVFARNSGGADNWGEIKILTASDGASGDSFGDAVAISGDTAVVGARNKASAGAAYVFERNSGGADNWGQVKELTASDGASGDDFGFRVAISGDTAVVGAGGKSSSQGAAYVFAVGCDDFSQLAEPVASDGATDDLFGYSVSISGDTAIVGAEEKGSIEGAVYIFERNSGGADIWGQVKILTASDRAQGNAFGTSVSIDGDTAVVGSTNNNSIQGAAYVFERNSGGADNWGQVKELTASDGAAGDRFGASVGISGDAVVVGAFGKSSFQGAAYVFERNSGGADNWGQVQELIASDGAANDWFGFSVAIAGDTAAVGAFQKSSFQGAAYVFERNFDPLNPGTPLAENWGQVQELTASDGSANDAFGFSVSVEADTALVGAFGKSSHQGAAYVFERNFDPLNPGTPLADNWGQVQELIASDGAANDWFGFSVAIDGDIAVVGSEGKSSHQGAAYMFERNSGGADKWGQVRELTASDGSSQDDFGFSVSVEGDTALVGALGKSSGQGAAYVFGCNLCTATSTSVTPASTQYSDPVDLSATVTSTGTVNTGTVKFSIVETGDVVGTASVVNGTATLAVSGQTLSSTTGHYPDLAANTYTIKAEYSGENDIWCASTNTATLTVSREPATVIPSASNPFAVKVNSPGGTAGPITLCADISDPGDDTTPGDISLAVPVTVQLTPILGSGSYSQTIVSGSVSSGTLHVCATFSSVAVNVYDVHFSIGGNYYTGSGDSVLAVYDPSLGFTTGGGRVINPNTGNPANFAFSVKYQKKGSPQGSVLYIEHKPNGTIAIAKSNSLSSVSIVKLSSASWGATILTKNTVFNGVGNYALQVTAIDNGEPGKTDKYGLKLINPNKSSNATYTFAPQTIVGGNIQVPH